MPPDLSEPQMGLVAERSAQQWQRQHYQIDQSPSILPNPGYFSPDDHALSNEIDRSAPIPAAVYEGTRVSISQRYKPQGLLDVFEKTCQRWSLSKDEQEILLGGQVGALSLTGRLSTVSRDMKDRIGYVVAISLGLGILFDENIQSEKRWLRQPNKKLQGKSPLDYMLEGSMQNVFTINDIVERERGI